MVDQSEVELVSPGAEGLVEQGIPPYIPKLICSNTTDLQGECSSPKAAPVAQTPAAPPVAPSVASPVAPPVAAVPPASTAATPPVLPVKKTPPPVQSGTPKVSGKSNAPLIITLSAVGAAIIIASIVVCINVLSPKKSNENFGGEMDCFELGDGPAFQECIEEMEKKGYLENTDDETDTDSGVSLVEMFAKVSNVEVTQSELRNYSKEELRIIRNSIFAKHGYIFKSDDLKTYFSQFNWYTPMYADVSNMLSPIERKNISTIKALE